jgi:acetyl-CoA C-acetyltransferase
MRESTIITGKSCRSESNNPIKEEEDMEEIKDRVAIVGMGCTQFGELWDKSPDDLVLESCLEAIEDAGIEPKDIKAGWFGTETSGNSGTALARPLKLEYIPISRVENVCCSGTDALRNAAHAVAAGVHDIALVCGMEKLKDHYAGFTWTHMPQDYSRVVVRAMPANFFAKFATRYFHHYGLGMDEGRKTLAQISVKNHHNGTLSPKAHLRREITVEAVLKSPMIAYPLTLFDACGMSDGGAAAILTTPEIAKTLKKDYILIKGIGLASSATQPYLHDDYDFLHMEENVVAAQRAYDQAGIKDPRKEIDIAEVHDCFSIHEFIIYEDLKFSPKGKAKEDVEAGTFTLEGELPVNSDGGLKCFGHPLGASGIRMIYEVYNQLLERADQRQIKNARIGLTHNLGGTPGPNSTVAIFGRPD